MTEEEIARMEANLIEADETYFNARPYFDEPRARIIFDAGFERGWKAAIKAMTKG